MMSSWKLPVFVLLSIFLAMPGAVALAGEGNAAPSAFRPSYSDDASRILVQHSFLMLKDREEDYRVGPGDLLEISIFEWELREETKTATFRVAESGIIALPVIGDLNVGGLPVGRINRLIESHLKRGGFIKRPRVSVDIKEFRSKLVSVVGSVNDPGVYTLRQNVTSLLDILSLAGGLNDRAGCLTYVIQTETDKGGTPAAPSSSDAPKGTALTGNPLSADAGNIASIDLYELMELGNLSLNMLLRNGDIVYVPEAQQFSVIGYVRAPGIFKLRTPLTVLDGIAKAGGLMERRPSPRSCVLIRRTEGRESIIPIDLVAISSGHDPNFYLMSDDIIEVRQTMAKKMGLGLLDLVKGVGSVSYWPGRN